MSMNRKARSWLIFGRAFSPRATEKDGYYPRHAWASIRPTRMYTTWAATFEMVLGLVHAELLGIVPYPILRPTGNAAERARPVEGVARWIVSISDLYCGAYRPFRRMKTTNTGMSHAGSGSGRRPFAKAVNCFDLRFWAADRHAAVELAQEVFATTSGFKLATFCDSVGRFGCATKLARRGPNDFPVAFARGLLRPYRAFHRGNRVS